MHYELTRRSQDNPNQLVVSCACGLRLGTVQRAETPALARMVRAAVLVMVRAHMRDVQAGALCGYLGCREPVDDHLYGLCTEHAPNAYLPRRVAL